LEEFTTLLPPLPFILPNKSEPIDWHPIGTPENNITNPLSLFFLGFYALIFHDMKGVKDNKAQLKKEAGSGGKK
jgi:hypothetical protein